MAIIYTYPKLTNPQGNELIVVSDVNNRNATRLITIASIASLIPSGGGCATAITGIVDSVGNPLYTPPACSDMELVSTDGTVAIASTGTGIDLSASAASGCEAALTTINTSGGPVIVTECDSAIEFSVLPESSLGVVGVGNTIEFSLGCPTESERGGIKASSVALPEPPEPSETGDYYPVQITGGSDCIGVVRIPSGGDPYVLPCATNNTLGGVKALENTTETVMPSVPDEGTYYSIEVVKAEGAASQDECRAIVKIPSTSVDCARPAVVGGIKANIVEIETLPTPADVGDYYPVEIIENETPSAADCFAVVKVPSSGGATPGDGQITITAGTGLTGGGSFTVNQAADTAITLNADGVAESGWSPFPITQGGTTLGTQGSAFTVFYHATADATFGINSIKMMLPSLVPQGGANKDDDFSVALYEGSLTDIENGGDIPTLIGVWDYTAGGAPVFGVKKVYKAAVTNVVAGNDYIIAVSVNAAGALLLGDGGVNTGTGTAWFSNDYLCQGNNNLYNSGGTGGAAAWPNDLLESELEFDNPWRYCIHFFSGGAPDDIEEEEEGGEEG